MRSTFIFLAFALASCAHSPRVTIEMVDMEQVEGVRVCSIEREGKDLLANCMDFENFVTAVKTGRGRNYKEH